MALSRQQVYPGARVRKRGDMSGQDNRWGGNRDNDPLSRPMSTSRSNTSTITVIADADLSALATFLLVVQQQCSSSWTS